MLALAGFTSLALAGIGLAGSLRGIAQWSFVVEMVGFAVEAGVAWVLLTATEVPESRLQWLAIHRVAALVLLIPWGVFVASLVSAGAR